VSGLLARGRFPPHPLFPDEFRPCVLGDGDYVPPAFAFPSVHLHCRSANLRVTVLVFL